MEPRRHGRPRKGDRAPAVSVRFPPEQRAAYQAEADAVGLPMGDYVVLVMCAKHNTELPYYIANAMKAHAERTREGALPLDLAG